MEILNRVMQMQNEGKQDAEIMAQLQNEGMQPAQINDAINQAKVKNAVSPPEQTQTPPPEGMQPSMMPAPETATTQSPPQPQGDYYTPQPQKNPAPEQQDNYYTPQPQTYSEQDSYPQQGSYDTETISEIAEQVATEKIEDYKSKVGDIASFRNQIQNQVDNIDDRLKRIETSIDKLQQAILGKIGEFGETSAMIHKDLDNLHGTVAGLMNPLLDNINEMKKQRTKK